MITVVDYGMGNLRNVKRAFETAGEEVEITHDPAVIAQATRLVLPGVGAFGEAIKRIDGLGLRQVVLDHARSGKPLIGICLGMQLLFDASEESPGIRGLGLFQGCVQKFQSGMKIPHIGWNDVVPAGKSVLFGSAGPTECFYYVHSYFIPVRSETAARTVYGEEFSAAVEQKNVFGVQFHPEKSQKAGLSLLQRFLQGTKA